MKKKILLTGGSGFIGKNIRESDLAQDYDIVAPSHADVDIADTESVDNFFKKNNFQTKKLIFQNVSNGLQRSTKVLKR